MEISINSKSTSFLTSDVFLLYNHQNKRTIIRFIYQKVPKLLTNTKIYDTIIAQANGGGFIYERLFKIYKWIYN